MALKGKINYRILPDPRDNTNTPRGPSSGSYLVYKHIVDAFNNAASVGVQLVQSSNSATEYSYSWLSSSNSPYTVSGTQTNDAYRFYKIRITTTGFPSDRFGVTQIARFSTSYDNGLTYPITNLIPTIAGTHIGDNVYIKFFDQQFIAGNEWNFYFNVNTAAWSVWRFNNASIPFYVGVFHYGNTTNAYSGSGLTFWGNNNPTEGGLGISVAMMQSGLNPWTGMTSTGTLWNTTSNVYLWPRSNNPGGLHQTNRNNIMPLLLRSDVRNFGVSGHIIFDEDNIAILNDVGNDLSYDFFYFGKINTYTASSVQFPFGNYTYICSNKFSSGWIFEHIDYGNAGTYNMTNPPVYGTISGSSVLEGGIAMFTGSLQTDSTRQKSGVKGFVYDLPSGLFYRRLQENYNTPYWPNSIFGTSAIPKIDVWSPSIIAWEYPRAFGVAGYVNWWGAAMQVNTHDYVADFSRAAFGNSIKYTVKAILPWSTTPPITGSLTGVLI